MELYRLEDASLPTTQLKHRLRAMVLEQHARIVQLWTDVCWCLLIHPQIGRQANVQALCGGQNLTRFQNAAQHHETAYGSHEGLQGHQHLEGNAEPSCFRVRPRKGEAHWRPILHSARRAMKKGGKQGAGSDAKGSQSETESCEGGSEVSQCF